MVSFGTSVRAWPWPSMLTATGQSFFGAAEAIYQDWIKVTSSKKMAVALLSIAEAHSGFKGILYPWDSARLKVLESHLGFEVDPVPSIQDQNEAAWTEMSDPEYGLRHALAAHTADDAARALVQYWVRPSDGAHGERAAAMAKRWLMHGNLL